MELKGDHMIFRGNVRGGGVKRRLKSIKGGGAKEN